MTPFVFALIFSLYGLGNCNVFFNLQSAVASEAATEPAIAQLNVARAVLQHGPCNWDENYLHGMRVARQAAELGDYTNHHARAYFNLYSFSPAQREPWAIAAYTALIESNPPVVSHFGSLHDQVCPEGSESAGSTTWCP